MRRKKKTKLLRKKQPLSSAIPKYPASLFFTTEDPIEKLKLPSKIQKGLIKSNIKSIGKLLKSKRKKLYKVNNLGKKSVSYLMKLKGVIRTNLKPIPPSPSDSTENRPQESINAYSFPLPEIRTKLRFSRNHSINVLGLPVKLEHALQEAGIHRLGELYEYPEKSLLKINNIGKRSVEYIQYVKSKILFGSQDSTDPENSELNNIPNDQLINYFINRCNDERSKEVIERRYGLVTGEKETLEEIGKSHGLTRERIRQIQLKAKKRLNHPSNDSKRPIINLVCMLIRNNGWIISDEEADRLVPTIFNNLTFDGSSLLDLMSDLEWIQTHEVGDVLFYSPKLGPISLGSLMDGIINVLKKKEVPQTVEEIVEDLTELKKISINDFDPLVFISRCCQVDPRIQEQVTGKFGLYVQSHRTMNLWVPLIIEILESEGAPLHFTEITERLKDLLVTPAKRIDWRRVHAILITKNTFAHVGIRGMYGLTAWGLRKEPTIEIVTEFIEQAGFPVHIDQIYDYVRKYKDSPKMNIRSILDISGRFENKGNGLYDLKGDYK